MFLDLVKKSSQNAGCILRCPASHCCQDRSDEWMSSAASLRVAPTLSRAARICFGDGLFIGPRHLRVYCSINRSSYGRPPKIDGHSIEFDTNRVHVRHQPLKTFAHENVSIRAIRQYFLDLHNCVRESVRNSHSQLLHIVQTYIRSMSVSVNPL